MAGSEILTTARRIARLGRRGPDVRELWARSRQRLADRFRHHPRLKRGVLLAGPAMVVVLALGAWLLVRPMPTPDYRRDGLKRVFTYTLLRDEFNRLPVDKRVELIGQLVERVRGMNPEDSVVLAAFAAGLAGEARRQVEENLSRLAVDLWDKYARQYEQVSPEDRAAFLDNTYLEFVRTMEAMSGRPVRRSDAQLLEEARRQAQRDQEFMRSGRRQPTAEELGWTFTFMRNRIGGHASPAQRTRAQLLMRDMVRHFRGEPLDGSARR